MERTDVPLLWPRDGEAEDKAAGQVIQPSRMARWNPETGKVAPETWETFIGPARGWAGMTPPEPRCHWCERPGPAPAAMCAACQRAQAAEPDPPEVIGWWAGMTPLARRTAIAAAHRTDPWTGQRVRFAHEATTAGVEDDPGEGVTVERARLSAAVPRTSWDTRHDS